MGYIDEWEWDDENVAHLARHNLTPKTVQQVSEQGPKFRENAEGLAAAFQMIGPDGALDLWTVCILESADHPGRWRAITGWRSTEGEQLWYWKVTE